MKLLQQVHRIVNLAYFPISTQSSHSLKTEAHAFTSAISSSFLAGSFLMACSFRPIRSSGISTFFYFTAENFFFLGSLQHLDAYLPECMKEVHFSE